MEAVICQYRRFYTALLTFWVTAVSLGVSVSHVHAGGATRHVHGLAFNISGVPCVPADGPGELHRHLILFGLEFPGEECPDVTTIPGETVKGDAVGIDCDAPVVDDAGFAPIISDSFILPIRERARQLIPRSHSISHVCTYALHTMTGVLRI